MSTATLTRIAPTASTRSLLRVGALAGLAAAATTTTVAGLGESVGVSLDVSGEPIPRNGFAVLTVACTLLGILLAVVLAKRAARARATFVKVTAGLVALSFVPDVLADAAVSTKALLIATHLIAAAIVVPALASRLPE